MTRAGGTMANVEMSLSDLLCRIRARAQELRARAPRDAAAQRTTVSTMVRTQLGPTLGTAILTRSPLEIAVVLGSAAEFEVYPDVAAMERCMEIVAAPNHRAARAVVWAVWHRQRRAQSRRGPALAGLHAMT